jgi:CubicO group peptidase (beta-lactamase class C family)
MEAGMVANDSLTMGLDYAAGEADPAGLGLSAAGLARVAAIFERQVADGLHPGAQLVVLRRGQVALDRAVGVANIKSGLPVTAETPFLCFSVTKPFTGLCIHQMIEQGRVSLDARVADYWPAFGCKGKQEVTIRQVFLHQAGIPSRGMRKQLLFWPSWRLITGSVARLEAEFAPGSKTAYHALNYGFVLGEVLRRVSGVAVRAYMQRELFVPLGMSNSWLGLPRAQRKRAAGVYCGDPGQQDIVRVMNVGFMRGAVVPAATLNSTARDIARFYQMVLNEGVYAGRRFVKPETLRAALTPGNESYDEYIGAVMRWGYGFHIGGLQRPDEPEGSGMGYGASLDSFGHFGQNSVMAWADRREQLVVVLTTNRLLNGTANTARFREISNAVWDALAG